jgi:outer membrane murein-binding lipoprotein Lpp
MKKVLKKVGKVVAYPVTAPVKLAKKGVEKTMTEALKGVIRTLVAAAFGGMVVSGALSQSQVDEIAGAIGTLLIIAWSVRDKLKAQQKQQAKD